MSWFVNVSHHNRAANLTGVVYDEVAKTQDTLGNAG